MHWLIWHLPDVACAMIALAMGCPVVVGGRTRFHVLREVPVGTARKRVLKHEGEEFIYVVIGLVELEYGEEVHKLKAGDSAYFDGQVEHRLVNSNTKPAKVLSVFG